MPLVVLQTIAPDPPDPALTAGVERYFETVFACAAEGGGDRWGRIKDPLQDALALSTHLLGPTVVAGVPRRLQLRAFAALARLATRRGRVAWRPAARMSL